MNIDVKIDVTVGDDYIDHDITASQDGCETVWMTRVTEALRCPGPDGQNAKEWCREYTSSPEQHVCFEACEENTIPAPVLAQMLLQVGLLIGLAPYAVAEDPSYTHMLRRVADLEAQMRVLNAVYCARG